MMDSKLEKAETGGRKKDEGSERKRKIRKTKREIYDKDSGRER